MRRRQKQCLICMMLLVVVSLYASSIYKQGQKSASQSDEETSYSEKSLDAMRKKLSAMEEKVLSWKAFDDYNFMQEHFYDAVLQAEPQDNPEESMQIDQTDHEDAMPWTELESLNDRKAPPDDQQLIKHLRKYWIYPPCANPYVLKHTEKVDFSDGQSAIVDKLLKQKTEGTFVECGATDGETLSNSLFFERERKWKGLLIEPGPINFRFLKNKHRKAYTTPACVGLDQFPRQMSFHRGRSQGRLIDSDDAFTWIKKKGMVADTFGVQCFPLYSLLLASNFTSIDYLSLDVSGIEFRLLKTIPFEKIDIKVISAESGQDQEGPEAVQDLIESKGYTLVDKVIKNEGPTQDYIFLKDSYLHLLKEH